ncbi:MAG: glutamate synthase large subunit [Ardenticatenia bacterium]|jgi:glutamate synthase (ferredoxin)|nr:MAG: glutamate synthase large subunit [Ardenticatenia bacterium]
MGISGERLWHNLLNMPRFEHAACGIGFVVNIKGEKSNTIVRQALAVLRNLAHRGATGADPNTGDGAGIMLQIPHAFFKKACWEVGIDLPPPGQYGVGMLFLSPTDKARSERICEQCLEQIVQEEGQRVLGWRTVPTDATCLGETARAFKPFVRQIFIGRDPRIEDDMAFERKLYVIRRRIENEIRIRRMRDLVSRPGQLPFGSFFYVSSMSHRTIVYKGMFTAAQLELFYPDLSHPAVESALALVHSRFSTNTFPSWDRAHPYRIIIHNGEINTLRGNVNWFHAGQAMFKSSLFGEDLQKVLPIINPEGSDSAILDNVLEFLVLSGRSLPHAIMMLMPEPWSHHESMSDEKRAFYEFHSALMEPWDGPAAVGFTDGIRIGAVLDRNGLRPARYYVTDDDLVIMASEVGVLDIPPERVRYKGRLEPGRMLLIDTEQQRIISDAEIKHQIATAQPYRQWLDQHLIELERLPADCDVAPPLPDHATVVRLQRAFGYTYEDVRLLIEPMAEQGVEPLGSMGNDAPLAVLSDRPQLLYNYFKQLFAQVTNPPIDAIREELVTSTELMIGSEGNLLEPGPESCRQIKLSSPILTNAELARLRYVRWPGFKSRTLAILFNPAGGGRALEVAMEEIYRQADQAIEEGVNILILSDREVGPDKAAIPALLAVSGLHHHLIRHGTRTRVSLVLESGEPREVHHFATLIGYGASAINPYLLYDTVADMIREGLLSGIDYEQAEKNVVKALVKGVVKVASKMGISTLQSYFGAQIFEAVGLHQSVIERYFTWTPSRIGGIGIDVIAQEAVLRHHCAFGVGEHATEHLTLEVGGDYQWRYDGEHHLWNPETIYKLQLACRTGDYAVYKEYAQRINDQTQRLATLRGLLDFKFADEPVPLEEVESAESLCKRFKTGAMSYGSISKEAHEALAIAMNRIGGKSNTGEGGEDPARYKPDPNGDSRNSAIKQVASARFGVTSEYLVNAQELQIKMAQGAKPGEGGQLPGHKVYPWIAAVRHATPGVGLISPPPHHDIYSIEDLAELIHDLKCANPEARISVKLVSEVGVGTIAAGVAKARADVVLISGYDGGTGASPRSSIRHAGLPWELGLAETHQTLLLNGLRDRIAVEVDGQLKTGRDVVIAALLGAEEFGFATAPLVALGCVMMRACHLDTCPVGIATQNPDLRRKFAGKPEHVVNFMRFVAQEVRELMAQLGFRTLEEMVGRADRLKMRENIQHWKAQYLDLSAILKMPDVPATVGRYCRRQQDHGLEKTLDYRVLLELCRPALEHGIPVVATLPVRNVDRAVGTMLGSRITRRYGGAGLPDDTIRLYFEGSAGQSFGAFIPRGLTLYLEGDANDYLGKGLSGGKIIVYPPAASKLAADENIIIGNVALYGATSGEAYICGLAGERFCVRNSGAHAVVEGVGDHGCEYMTGGRVVVLGKTGRNFAAGMSGGIAYVLDETGDFPRRCNQSMVWLERLENAEEVEQVRRMIERHAEYTRSQKARHVLENWGEMVSRFVKVMPKDYKRMLETVARVKEQGVPKEEAFMIAFDLNKMDSARIGGN